MAGEKVLEGNGVRAVLTVEEVNLIVQGLESLRAQTERAIAKETDQVVVDARRRRINAIRNIISKEMFNVAS